MSVRDLLFRWFPPPAPRFEFPDVDDENHRLTLIDLARKFLHVQEGTPNHGARVEAIQRWCHGKPGDSWCCHFVTMVLDLHYGGKAPVPRHGSCDVVLALARTEGWIVPANQMDPGDVYLRLKGPTDAVHIGFCTTRVRRVNGKDVFGQLSGNASKDGLSSNGDGVYERDIPVTPQIVFVRLPRPSPRSSP